jgi:hypothetical protein
MIPCSYQFARPVGNTKVLASAKILIAQSQSINQIPQFQHVIFVGKGSSQPAFNVDRTSARSMVREPICTDLISLVSVWEPA